MLLHPLLDSGEVEKERYVITEELHMVKDSPVDLVFSLLAETMWSGHPLGRDVAGTEEGVGAIQREDLQTYLRKRYIPSRIVAVVAGATPSQEVEEVLFSALGGLAPGDFVPAEPALEDTAEPRLRLVYRDIGQVNLCVAFPALSYHHPDRYVLMLLNTILGGGMSSRLFQSIREDRALAYNTFSTLRQYADTGAVVIYAGIKPSRIEECLEAVWDELQMLLEKDVAQEELSRAKEYNKGRLLLRMEDSYGVASWHGSQEILLEHIREVDQVIAEIEAVQPADLRRLAGELFQRKQVRMVVLGPLQDEALLQRAVGLD
jgi:predicted Zn-dependent peptidase